MSSGTLVFVFAGLACVSALINGYTIEGAIIYAAMIMKYDK